MYKKSIFLVLSLIFFNSLSPQLLTRNKLLNTITPQQACCAKKLMWGSLCTLSCGFGGFWGVLGIMAALEWRKNHTRLNDSTILVAERFQRLIESRLKCLLFSALSLACIAGGLYSGNKVIKAFSR